MSKTEKTTVPIKKSKGSYQKEIVVDEEQSKATVERRQRGEYYVFEIPVNTKITFHLKVLKASNMEATAQNVYWVAQSHKDFGTRKWLQFKKTKQNGAERPVVNELPLHEFLNSLNKGTIHEKPFLEDGTPNPDYDIHTIESTKGVGVKYVPANPYKDRFTKRKNEALYGDIKYTAEKLGEGIWLEGINFTPEYASQGAFIIAVDEPQILSFFVEKRHLSENEVRKNGAKKGDTDHVAQELVYGEMMDLHLRLHNVFDYTADLEIFCDDESMDVNENGVKYVRTIPLIKAEDIEKKRENPSLFYNLNIIDELVTDIRWASKSNHEEGEDFEDSLQDYKMVLTLRPVKKKNQGTEEDNRPVLKREVTFTVNYRGDFSLEEQEHKYVTQIVKVKQPPLVTQSYETCKYTSLTLTIGDQAPFDLLREEEDGSLSGSCADNKTAVYELVAGNVDNVTPVTIDIDADVSTCEDTTERHQNNTFNLKHIEPIEYKKGEGTWRALVNKNIFPEVQPYIQDGEVTESQLKFKAAYPYNAWSEDTFLFKYLTWQIDPIELHIGVQSCRYVRTPSIYIYPDMIWALHFNYGVKEDEILYFQNDEVGLISGYAQYMDYIKDAILWIYEPFKEYFDKFFPKGNQDKLEEMIEAMGLDDDRTYARLGFHAKYDGDKLINYSDLQPYKGYMYYLIFQMVMISLAVDLLILYLTRGRALQGKALKLQKVLKRVRKTKERIEKATGLEFAILYPKINANSGIYKIAQENGEIATIIEATIQAKPLIGLDVKYEYDFNEKKGVKLIDSKGKEHKIKKWKWLEKFIATLKVSGQLNTDINVKYNTLTEVFSINQNGKQQKLKNKDILKNESVIRGEISAESEAFIPVTFGSNPVTVNVEINGKASFSLSEAKIFGVDAIGPFFQMEYTIGAAELSINTVVEARKGRLTLYDIKKAFLNIFGIEKSEPDLEKIVMEERKYRLHKMYLFDPLRQFKDKTEK